MPFANVPSPRTSTCPVGTSGARNVSRKSSSSTHPRYLKLHFGFAKSDISACESTCGRPALNTPCSSVNPSRHSVNFAERFAGTGAIPCALSRMRCHSRFPRYSGRSGVPPASRVRLISPPSTASGTFTSLYSNHPFSMFTRRTRRSKSDSCNVFFEPLARGRVGTLVDPSFATWMCTSGSFSTRSLNDTFRPQKESTCNSASTSFAENKACVPAGSRPWITNPFKVARIESHWIEIDRNSTRPPVAFSSRCTIHRCRIGFPAPLVKKPITHKTPITVNTHGVWITQFHIGCRFRTFISPLRPKTFVRATGRGFPLASEPPVHQCHSAPGRPVWCRVKHPVWEVPGRAPSPSARRHSDRNPQRLSHRSGPTGETSNQGTCPGKTVRSQSFALPRHSTRSASYALHIPRQS